MITKYPVYYEAKYIFDDEPEVIRNDGGFIFAESYADAAQQIEARYGNDLVSMTLEMLDDWALVFEINEARKIKDMVEAYNIV
jgi:hypothetical protein